jgi:hypothetical protein
LCIANAGAPFDHRAGVVRLVERRACFRCSSSRRLPLLKYRRTRFTTRQQPVVAFAACPYRAFARHQWRMPVPRWSWRAYQGLSHLLLQRAPPGGIVRLI